MLVCTMWSLACITFHTSMLLLQAHGIKRQGWPAASLHLVGALQQQQQRAALQGQLMSQRMAAGLSLMPGGLPFSGMHNMFGQAFEMQQQQMQQMQQQQQQQRAAQMPIAAQLPIAAQIPIRCVSGSLISHSQPQTTQVMVLGAPGAPGGLFSGHARTGTGLLMQALMADNHGRSGDYLTLGHSALSCRQPR